ncbi:MULTISPECIES: alpha/beta hydrolase [Pseudonocardia]|uniref:Carboxylesterase A n=2 Tax=Pseudonocardia TaxID=1847 RepID=A0A1Y2MVK4_PSEAH|nr:MULTISPECIES: alpha/beta fold hydrolase [Pseudonocardia]OSY38668.1 Carboxylesterase A precursor [Pseudonocardia autotrophica]TDN74870.1 pimeloyl-ACP methyl ester carboxylesterase [Pseudonocardia autotrophica]BBF98809.1 hypothetical protein Pdca_00190 [Pseudonocardia autotrophica]GEC26527.1 hypothetical protein PSA01_35560 [Pseudonocardia saturnea]
MSAVVPLLEIVLPFVVGLAVVLLPGRFRTVHLLLLAGGTVVATVVPWVLLPERSIVGLVELQLVWAAPMAFWCGVAVLIVNRRPRRERGPRSRVVRRAVRFGLLFGAGIGISALSALFPFTLFLGPREITWPVRSMVRPAEIVELALPALTSFHGHLDGWAWNRALLLLAGLLLWAVAGRRARRVADGAGVGSPAPARPVGAVGALLVLAAAAVTVSVGWPSPAGEWRWGWAESRIDVPVDAAAPDGPTIEISYLVHPARDTTTPHGVVVAAVGGPSPGSQSRDQLVGVLDPIAGTHDVVVSDYRGFGRSTPLACPDVDLGGADASAVSACYARLGPMAGTLGAQSAAGDLEAVRRALGVDRWSLYGQSYGTLFAQAYAEQYPRAVRSVVLDSALPLVSTPDFTFTTSQLTPPADTNAWQDAIDRARAAGPGAPRVTDLATIQLFSTWSEVAAGRDAALRLPPERRSAELTRVADDLNAQLSAMRNDPLAGLVPPQPTALYACNDYPMPFAFDAAPAEREATTRRYAEDRFTTAVAPFTWQEVDEALRAANGLRVHGFRYEACLYGQGRPHSVDPSALPTVPVLVISGSEDYTTTPAMADSIGAQWGATVLKIDGADHFVLLDNHCARRATAAFLDDPRSSDLPRCAAEG